MSTGAQIDLDWAGTDAAPGAAQAPSRPSPGTAAEAKFLTDEEILGINSPSPNGGYGELGPHGNTSGAERDGAQASTDAVARLFRGGESSGVGADGSVGELSATDGKGPGSEDPGYSTAATPGMPAWMAAAAADPRHSAEAAELWREHQEFRAAFGSPEEARAVKELLPGGVRDALSLREATQSVERIDAALFSGDARAQAEVVAEIARANPAAFRSLFAEASKVLAGLRANEAGSTGTAGREARNFDGSISSTLTASPTPHTNSGQALRQHREGWGTQNSEAGDSRLQDRRGVDDPDGRGRGYDDRRGGRGHSGGGREHGSEPPPVQSAGDPPPGDPPDMSGGSVVSGAPSTFDPAAYTQFERATNDAVARDVRGSISDTLSRVMPEGVAEGAARRIGEDIFHEVHRALAADRALSEQVAAVLRERRFGAAEQQRVSALLAGRARQLVPSVARRVIGEWTSSVLSTARSKAARQATAASRVDIATAGGSLDSMPLRSHGTASRQVNYAAMSDEEILGA